MAARATFTTSQQTMMEGSRGEEAYGARPPTSTAAGGGGPTGVYSASGGREGGSPPTVVSAAGRETSASELEQRRKTGRRDVEAAEREEEAVDVNPQARGASPRRAQSLVWRMLTPLLTSQSLYMFTLAYAFVLGLTALGLAITGGSTNYWVSARYIDNTPQGPLASFFHGGFWHTCGPKGCKYISPTKARPFQNSSQAFFFLLLFILALGAIFHLVALAAAKRKAHTDLAKTSGLLFTLSGICGIIAMSSYVGKTQNNLATADSIFYSWSFGLFTASWATLLGLVVPLCYIATEH